jgi:hypothetical protein
MHLNSRDIKCFQSEVAASLQGWYRYSTIQQLHTNLCMKSACADLLISETTRMLYKTKYNVHKTVSLEHILRKRLLYYFRDSIQLPHTSQYSIQTLHYHTTTILILINI